MFEEETYKAQGSLLFVTYTIIQGIISSEMQVAFVFKVIMNILKLL